RRPVSSHAGTQAIPRAEACGRQRDEAHLPGGRHEQAPGLVVLRSCPPLRQGRNDSQQEHYGGSMKPFTILTLCAALLMLCLTGCTISEDRIGPDASNYVRLSEYRIGY